MLKQTGETIGLCHIFIIGGISGLSSWSETYFWWLDNSAIKLPWPFLPFVSFLFCMHDQGLTQRGHFTDKEEGVNFLQFFADIFYGKALLKLYSAKNVLWTAISI